MKLIILLFEKGKIFFCSGFMLKDDFKAFFFTLIALKLFIV